LRICIFTNHFYPENFKVNDIAFEFAQKGYEVTVITAIPDYPQGRFYDGYSLFKRRKEIVNEVQIIRLPIIPRRKGRKIELILNYVSYFISALVFSFFHSYISKYDVVFVHLVSPFFISLPAVLLKRRQNIPIILWVLDLWPESLSAWGGVSNKLIIDSQIKLVQYVYNNCEIILIGSEGFRKSICEKGNYNDKLIYFPNWAESVSYIKGHYQYQQLKPFVNKTDDDFIFLFAGNMGEAQNLDSIIDTIAKLKKKSVIKFVFLGDGRKKDQLINKVNKLSLSESVFFLGHYPLNTMPAFLQMADVLLVSLKDELISNLTIPQKVQFYMSQGKPILAILNGDGADLIKTAQCGIAIPPNDPVAFKSAIQEFYCMSKEELYILGTNGKNYYNQHFRKVQRIEQLSELFKKIISC
jgi:glycosyltransferase involved in cell wall biosynthesis